MVDPLSATASIIAVIQISGTVLSACYHYIASVNDAPRDIEWVISEVGSLKSILDNLKELVCIIGDHSALSKALGADNGPLKTCESALKVLSDKLSVLANVSRPLSRLTWPLKEKTVHKILEVIQKQKNTLILALHADEIRAIATIEAFSRECSVQMSQILESLAENTDVTLSIQDTIQEAENSSKREKILKWLRTTDPSHNHVAAWEEHEPNTGDWLLSSPDYSNWRDTPGQSAWLNGISGCGKTVLSATVIEDIKRLCLTGQDYGYAYYYFDFNDVVKRKPLSMVQSVLAQLVDIMDSLPASLQGYFEDCGKGEQQPTFKDLRDVLISVMQQRNRTYVILDALDESSERAQLLDVIGALHISCTNVNFFLASRKEYDISTRLFSVLSHDFRFENTAIAGDIRLYVRSRLSTDTSLEKWPKIVKMEIEEALVTGSDGMFRWAFCQLDSLKKCHNLRSLRQSLQSLPQGLYNTYNRMLLDIPKLQQAEGESVLLWLAYAEQSLTLDMIADAVVVDRRNRIFTPEDRFFDVHDILNMCSSLVSLEAGNDRGKREQDPLHDGSRILQLAHYSVKEYIVSQRGRLEDYPILGLTNSGAHRFMAETCLVYVLSNEANSRDGLSLCVLGTASNPDPSDLDEYDSLPYDCHQLLLEDWPFNRYAALFWYVHYQKVDAKDDASVTDLMMSLFNHGKTRSIYRKWYKFWEQETEPLQEHRKLGSQPLVFASHEGVTKAVKALLDRELTKIDLLNRALIMACTRGWDEIVEMLLVAGAETDYRITYSIPDIGMENTSSYTAIQVAAKFIHPETVRLLLKAGGDANTPIGGYLNFEGHLLHEACILNQPEIVKVLIDGGADLNAKGSFTDPEGEYTPLELAVRSGYETIVKLLVSSNVSGSTGLDTDIIRKARSVCLYGPLAVWKKMAIMQDLGYCTDFDMTTVKYPKDIQAESQDSCWKSYLVLGEDAELRLIEATKELEEESIEAEAAELLARLQRLRSS